MPEIPELILREKQALEIRNRFIEHSTKADINKCEQITGIILPKFARKFINQKLNESDLPDEEKYNIKTWEVNFETNKIVNKGRKVVDV